MHHRGRIGETRGDAGAYAGHSHGYVRRAIVDRAAGSVHQEVVIAELDRGGTVARHIQAFEEALYVLEGTLLLEAAGAREELGADDYVFVDRAVPHALSNPGDTPARWLEVNAPQPGAELQDIVFVGEDAPVPDVEEPYRRWHFDVGELPEPTGSIGLAGFGGGNVGGAVARVIVGPDTGASQVNLMVVRYVPGGFITLHDHAFEESFFFLSGEIEAELDGELHTLREGDYFWSGVGSMHALVNRSEAPVLWLETQAPQPPARYQARFVADWERLVAEAG